MSKLKAALPILAAIGATWFVATATAQPSIPNGVFVQELTGTTWLILDGKRVSVPLWPATDPEIQAIPKSGQWATMNDSGTVAAGSQPSWCGDGVPCYVRRDPPAAADAPKRRTRVGETFTLVGLTDRTRGYRAALTVNQANLNVTSMSRADDPPSTFMMFDITVTNEGSVVLDFSTLDFKVQTVDGFLVDYSTRSMKEPQLDDDDLGPGQTSRGWLAFQIPKGQEPESFIFQPSGSTQWVIADLRPQG